jgi:hypothetical protein
MISYDERRLYYQFNWDMKSQSQSQGVADACLMGSERMRMDRVRRECEESER